MQEEIVNLLKLAFTSTDNALRTKSEQTLFQKAMESIEVFQILGTIASSDNQSQEQASALLNNVVLRMFTGKTQLNLQHAKILFGIVGSHEAQLKCKLMLTKALSILLKLDKNIRGEIENQMRILLRSDSLKDIQSGIVLFKVLTDSLELHSYNFVMTTDLNFNWIGDFLQLTSGLATLFVKNTSELSQEIIQVTKFYLSTISEFCEKVFKFKQQTRESLIPIQNTILHSIPFSGTLLAILQYFMPKGNQIQNCIISCTGDISFDNQINELKMYTLKCYMNILNVLLNHRNKADQKKGVFQPQLSSIVQLLIYSCLTYLGTYSVPNILNLQYQSNIFTYIFKIMANAGAQTDLYQLFSDAKISLITDVIYPFLVTSKKEYEQMMDQPEEFVNLALDTVDKQESEVPKTAVATLLETLCDHIDGSTSFLAQLSILIAQASISEYQQQIPNLSDQEKQFILLIKDKKVFTDYSCIDRIESSLILLTIMSYLIQKRVDIINMMEKLLVDNYSFFLNSKEQIIKVRLAVFFGYFCDNLFKSETQSQNMINYLEILISQVQPESPVVLYQSIDALKDVFEDEDLKLKTKSLVINVFPPLCQGLQYSTYERHFEMIINLIKTHPLIFKSNENLLIGLLQILAQRVLIEQQNVKNGQKDRFIYVNRCWNIIRALPEIPELQPLLPTLEQHLLILYQSLAAVNQIDYEEDLLLFVTSIIEKINQVTPTQIQLLPTFSSIIKKQHDRMSHLFETLNYYITFGTEYFLDEANQTMFFNLAFQTLQSEEEFLSELDQGEGALLLQLGIQILGEDLKPNILQNIINKTLTLLHSGEVKGYLRSRVTGVILSALYTIPQQTYQHIQNIFQQLLDELTKTQYSTGYDIKLFVITMCKLVMQQHSLLNSDLVSAIVQLLLQQQKQESEEKVDDDDSFDDEKDSNEDEYQEEEERQQALIQIEQFQSKLIKIDEFQEFKNMILAIKQQYPQVIEQLRKSMTAMSFGMLSEMMAFIRIQNNDGTDQARKIITVKQKKLKP